MFRFGVLYLYRGREARCFSSQAYQFLTRLYKEYDLVKIPGSLLVRLQFDLVMREWIVIQEIQQFPLQILLT